MAEIQAAATPSPTCMESVNRIAKLPVVESSIHAATSVYEKVKEFNSVTQWTCTTAESVVNKAVEVGKPIATPIVHSLEGPIKKVDDVLCSGLDYVESKVPAVKLPPGEIAWQMYTTTKDYVNNTVTPKACAAYAYVEPAVKSAYERIEPAVETAKHVVEPAVERAMTIVEPAVEMAKPYVEPYIEKAKEIVEPMVESIKQKMEEIKNCAGNHPEGDLECEACQAAARKMEEEH